jgi:flagellar biosynthesis protein FlhB
MADDADKTEEATDKKIEDARKDGNVPKSMDMTGFVGLLVGIAALMVLLPIIMNGLLDDVIYYTSFYGTELTIDTIYHLAVVAIRDVAFLVLPLASILALAGVIANLAQFGFIITTKPLIPDIKKIDPIKGAKNLFSMKKIVEGIKITAKVAVAFGVGSFVFLGYVNELQEVIRFSFRDQLEWLADKAMVIALIMLMVFFVFGVIDLVIVRYQYFKQLRMSKNDLKDEYKQQEGNPEIKARIRRLQHEMSNNRMMADVPDADVIIKNPTHFAVALKYDKEVSPAPLIVAKGADNIALKIIEIGEENGVYIHEDKRLAQDIYRLADVGDQIPEELFGAIAEVLALVFKAENRS